MKEYIIKEGNHYCLHPIKIHYGVKRVIADFVLTDSCIYDLGTPDQFDFNKLVGLGWGWFHHKNSYRIGTRYDVVSKRFELSHYSYNNKKRIFPVMCSVEPNQQVRSIMSFSRSSNTIWNKIIVFEKQDNVVIEKVIYDSGINFDFTNVPKWGFVLYPYQGGNCPAQHRMKHLLDIKY